MLEVQISEIRLCSSIAPSYRQELEELFFFNPRQGVTSNRVAEHVERYGKPEVRFRGQALTLDLKLVDRAQTLFLLSGNERPMLLGVVLYIREAECLRVLYVALRQIGTLRSRASCTLLLFIVDFMSEIGARIKGVRFLKLSIGTRDAVFKIKSP